MPLCFRWTQAELFERARPVVGPWMAVVMLWVPFCVMVLMGSWWCPIGACCTMVTVCSGAVDPELWMI